MLTATVPPPVVAEVRRVEVIHVKAVEASPVEALGPPLIATGDALEQQALRDDFAIGFPPHLPSQAREIDVKTCRRLRCPACHSRGMECKPFHRIKPLLPCDYRVVASCPTCGAGEVV